MATILTQQQIYDLFITELLGIPESPLTDTAEGAIVDILAGVTARVLSEMSNLTVREYAKTFFDSADGPDITGGPDDLQTLAVDHFGDEFARPGASKAGGTVTFSRATTAKGDVTIAAGTAVTTAANAQGAKTRFLTASDVVLTGLSISATVIAETAGTAGNIAVGKITTVETTLTDASVVVTNAAVMSGGEEKETDPQYRETIRNKLQGLKGATLIALKAIALTVPGVVTATAFELLTPVIQYNIGTGLIEPGAVYFQFPYAKIYVADVNGTASGTLIADVQAAIDASRAAGVKVTVVGAAAISQNWTASITLNAGGPNFAELSTGKTKLLASMSTYVNNLAIGSGFTRAAANTAILAIWGPTGTNDLTAFSTSTPTGDVAITATQKLVAGTMSIV